MVVVYICLFIVFASFTDPVTGVFNSVIIAIVVIAFNNQKREDSNSPQAKEQVYQVQQRLSQEIFLHLKQVFFQAKRALVLYHKMRQELRKQEMEVDSDASEASMSASFMSASELEGSTASDISLPDLRADSPTGSVDLTAPDAVQARLRQMLHEGSDSEDDAESDDQNS
jgi:hypothetical protein